MPTHVLTGPHLFCVTFCGMLKVFYLSMCPSCVNVQQSVGMSSSVSFEAKIGYKKRIYSCSLIP